MGEYHASLEPLVETCSALQRSLTVLDVFLEGKKNLPNGQNLREVLGDYHAEMLQKNIRENYGVVHVGGVLIVDQKKVKAILEQRVKQFSDGYMRGPQLAPQMILLSGLLGDVVQYVMRAADAHEVRPVGLAEAKMALDALDEPFFQAGINRSEPHVGR